MALIQCETCGATVDAGVASCPRCACDPRTYVGAGKAPDSLRAAATPPPATWAAATPAAATPAMASSQTWPGYGYLLCPGCEGPVHPAAPQCPNCRLTARGGRFFRPRGWFKRFVAAIVIDTVAVFFIVLVILGMSGVFDVSSEDEAELIFSGALALGLFIYWTFCESVWATTPGKRVLRLTVIGEQGAPCTAGAAALRNLFKVGALWLPLGGIVTLIVIAASEDKRRVGDRVAHTQVVRDVTKEIQARMQVRFAGMPAYAPPPPAGPPPAGPPPAPSPPELPPSGQGAPPLRWTP